MSNKMNNNCSGKNPAAVYLSRIIDDPVPFLFFGSLVSLKIYHFIGKIDLTTDFVSIMYGIDQSMSGIKAILFSRPVLDLFYTITAILFDLLIIISYLIRVKPVSNQGKAKGFWEMWYPIITVLIPMISFTYLLYRPIPVEKDPLFRNLYQSATFVHSVGLAGFLLSLIGCTLSIIVLWKLKNSFSLMVEVRELVTDGMYKYMRHPLYAAELTHALGTTLLLLNSASISIYILFFTLEAIRAKFEERKLLAVIPEYADYKARTGFFFPKFGGAPQKAKLHGVAQRSF
ncbi:MAG: isoprenylcysteine carboxylmethyltransferase family protein [bacterium]|nr:isoprenylcysteine carboxylmethyltransferase family protein [bacterium]